MRPHNDHDAHENTYASRNVRLKPRNLIATIEYRRTHEPEGSDVTLCSFVLPHEYVKYHELLAFIVNMGYLVTAASVKPVG